MVSVLMHSVSTVSVAHGGVLGRDIVVHISGQASHAAALKSTSSQAKPMN